MQNKSNTEKIKIAVGVFVIFSAIFFLSEPDIKSYNIFSDKREILLSSFYVTQNEKSEKININLADKDALTALKGVGEKTAEAIIKYRLDNGGFKTAEEIKNVSGIGDKKFEDIKDFITADMEE